MAGNAGGAESAAGDRRFRVLLVDDAADLRLMLRLNLEASGRFSVIGEAADGAEGTVLARERQPDLILLDIAMPGQDGFEALPELRAAAPDACIVMLSSFEEYQLGKKARDLGAAAYIEKSVTPDRLPDHLAELMTASAG